MSDDLRPAEFPCTRWMVSLKKYSSGYPQSVEIHGETSRSWLTGSKWRPDKLAKKENTLISDEDARRIIWAWRMRKNVARLIEHSDLSYEVVKQVYDAVGVIETRCPQECKIVARNFCQTCRGEGYIYSLRGDQ